MKKLFFVFVVVSSSILGQEPAKSHETTWQLLTYDIESVFGGMGHAYSRPLPWEGSQWLTFGGITAATVVIYLFDETSSEYFVRQEKDIPNIIMGYGERVGNPQNNYMLTGAVYLSGLLIKNEKLRRTGVLLVSSASAAGLLQQISKTAIGRARPSSGKTKDTFAPFSFDKAYDSFPSGHTILAFTNAYAIAKQFKSPWIKGGLYAVGLIPGMTRLWAGKHWLSDVTLGVALSIFTVEAIDKYLDRRYDEKYSAGTKKLDWSLNFAPGQIGLVMTF